MESGYKGREGGSLAEHCPPVLQPSPLTEVDGAIAADFFTVLCSGQRFTEDQWRNMQAFSMLRTWLQHSGPGGSGGSDAGEPHTPEHRSPA